MDKNLKMVICRNCNNPIYAKAKVCPSCGAKNKKPFYKKGWFIILVLIAVIGVIGSIGGSGEKIKWSEMELGNILPEPPSNKGTLHENSAEQFWVSLYDVSDADYNDYLNDCIDMGFTVDANKDSNSYKAYNSEGYCLDMRHIGKNLSIDLKVPMALGSITWPTSTAGNQLPTPKSTTGKFSFEHEDSFFVYVGNMSKADYDEYVAACSEKGFNVDYNKGNTYYYADNSEGWHVSLKYEGNSVMSIRINAPDEEENSETTKPEESTKPEETIKTEENTKPEENNNDKNNTGLDPDFKAAMDSYEKFMDKYVAFMKKYSNNPSDVGLLVDYAKFMSDYADFVEDFEKWGDADLNTEETKYYIEVQSRVTQKLLETSE